LTSDFEPWLADTFAERGAFTALIVLVRIADPQVTPLCSTYVNVIGREVAWDDMVVMLAGAGHDWDGVAFFPEQDRGRPLDNPTARTRLRLLEQRLDDDRLVLNEGRFFDRWGRFMRIDEADPR
jgi:hypothetical protein